MKPTLPTNYKDDILNTSVEGKRRYRMIYNDDNTVSFVDVTPYDQTGSDFGAGDINLTNEAVNQSADAGKIIDDPDTAEATTEEGYIAGVQLFNHVNDSLQWKLVDSVIGKTAITLPENFDEVLISLYLDDNTSFTIHIPKLDLTSVNKIYREGKGLNAGSTYYLTQVKVYASLTTVVLDAWSDSTGNTNTDSSSKIKVSVYYR